MSRRPLPTLADYAVIAISPALIMCLVGSLVFFLIEVFYSGSYDTRLSFIMAMFVMAAVSIVRISIEQGRGYATMFAIPLAIVTAIATFRFVEFSGPMRAFSPLINIGLIALIWWCADKLTWDSTVIDESQDSSGAGLLKTAGLNQLEGGEDPANAEKLEGTSQRAAATQAAPSRPPSFGAWLQKFSRDRKRPHAPGVWVIYFSLAALPIFGFGNWFVPSTDLEARRYVFKLLVAYVGSALALLVTTSFLGLRRYLRQRRLEMPLEMSGVWFGTGAAMIVALLMICMLLPRRNAEYSVTQLPAFAGSPSDLWTTEYAVGNEGQQDPEKADRTGDEPQEPTADGGKSDSQGGQQSNDQQKSDQPSESGSQSQQGSPSKSGSSSNSQKNDSDSQQNQQSSQGKSNNDQQNQQNDSGQSNSKQDQQGQSQKSDSQQGTDGKSPDGKSPDGKSSDGKSSDGNSSDGKSFDEKSSDGKSSDDQSPEKKQGDKNKSDDQQQDKQQSQNNQSQSSNNSQQPDNKSESSQNKKADNKQNRKPQKNQSEQDKQESGKSEQANQQPQTRTRFDPSKIPSALGGSIGQLLKLLYWVIVIAIVGYVVWRYHRQIREAIRNFIESLRNLWASLFGQRTHEMPPESAQPVMAGPPPKPFAAFSDPFLTGMAETKPASEVIRYSFEALEAWARDNGFPRGPEQTPHEFAANIGRQQNALARDAATLAELYARCAYGKDATPRSSVEHLRRLWLQLRGGD